MSGHIITRALIERYAMAIGNEASLRRTRELFDRGAKPESVIERWNALSVFSLGLCAAVEHLERRGTPLGTHADRMQAKVETELLALAGITLEQWEASREEGCDDLIENG